MIETAHEPVLYHEIILALNPKHRGHYVDGTLGAGGHAAGILKASAPDGELLGLDVDPQALELAKKKLAEFGPRVTIIRASYTTLTEQLAKLGWTTIEGMLLDLGASSMQFDTPKRGFSFQSAGELDMRFDPTNPLTAAHLVNELSEAELANLLFRYGEEPRSRQITKAVIAARPIVSTIQLAEIINSVTPSRDRLHPATRTFQALRIAVNDELMAIEKVLPQAIHALSSGGRLAVISFHSLEDRIVKSFFRQESKDCLCPPRQPICNCGHKASIRELNRRPGQPTDQEFSRNPRARSAKLRVVEKI
ncbi:MAG: 16S rRNA (cytosine(1402)-N(4))-methyltransferase [Chloroflexi bacterium GWB2_49_20]|nr:MAG: 16S rRNA (cytosine(1402)-N(4))-methyltransferase [Chloroflexi bacterium GWB2_49_20]OGN76125.1 MAG: 16S rRNA (cytosine(1402)-N(4))-methyltransferase [Chloroflexi bacterium GWC2_49_37]OGN83511.1 MAG: 16S rRNA (cytosine(1402)-N(4))-methyltransferase [Chloroflexi bacterium GWD2_49_16]HBG73912.1 16S rRNA (cytosine(1402)-N(4))-methyltransferase [Anaerolineae bacterium]HCC79508.1 16S rRNA (cytosine(1402)-N(4))-methyltransferase [Anaerolineae bacterium]